MIKSRLSISGVDFPFLNELPISITKAIADVRTPDKRDTSASKSIYIPADEDVIKFFERVFQVNAQLTSFNPNLKVPAEYFVNEVRVFKGGLQLLKIRNTISTSIVPKVFECSIIGDEGNIFLALAGLYLTDVDLTDIDHVLTFHPFMFAPPILGTGYAYPYIDNGLNPGGAMNSNVWVLEHLKPAVFERYYISKIFESAGYSIQAGGYFDTDYAKRIIIPDVNEGALRMSPSDVTINQFYVGRNSTQTTNIPMSYAVSQGWFYNTTFVDVENDVDSVAPFSDPGNRYNTGTFIFTTAITQQYNLQAKLNWEATINSPAGTVSTVSPDVVVILYIEKNTGSGWVQIATGGMTIPVPNDITPVVSGSFIANWNGTLNAGDQIRVRSNANFGLVNFLDGVGANITTGTVSVDFDFTSGTYLTGVLTNQTLPSGGSVIMNQTIPTEVTQIDFITSIIKEENLYIELSKEIDTEYIIKSREDFIDYSDPLDWTDKLDTSVEQEILPMGNLDAKRYIFTGKADTDVFNALYENTYKEIYGSEIIDVENDFIKNDKKIESVFSPTPIAGHANSDIVAARLFGGTTSAVQPMKCNIRRLYWAGLIDCADHTFYKAGVASTQNQYPFAGHVDNPSAPTIDLNFGLTRYLYWTLPAQTMTDNNRYNERYSKFIYEITNQQSKIVNMNMYLTEQDINKFTFSRPVFILDAYYLVNMIKGYDPQTKRSCSCELLKLNQGLTFTPSSVAIEEITEGGGPSGQANQNGSNGVALGSGNQNYGENSSIVGGSDNYISPWIGG